MNNHGENGVPGGIVMQVLAVLWLALVPAAAVAHEDAVLTPAHSVVAAGDSLQLAGRKFSAGKSYEIRLVGPLRDFPLGSVRADSAGRFLVVIATPREALPGFYQLTATADDGDIVARADLTVTAGSSPGDGRPKKQASGMPGMPVTHAGKANIEKTRSGIEWIVIGLLIGGSAFLGLWSLNRAGRDVASSGGGGDQDRNDVLAAAPRV